MNILWMAWKDAHHPDAGGAEIVKSQLCRRLVSDGHSVIQIVAGFNKSEEEVQLDGCRVIRIGGRYSVYWQAMRYYQRRLKNWADIVIDECNTVPFFARFYSSNKSILFIHQLAGEIWFYQMKWPLNIIGYILEPLYLRLLRESLVITVSKSTRTDLLKLGFTKNKIKIIREGIEVPVVNDIFSIKKNEHPSILYIGSLRPMKRPDHVIKAFIKARSYINDLQLIIAGSGKGKYFDNLKRLISSSGCSDAIRVTGWVTNEKKIQLMTQAHLIVVASVKEGWGLIVTEAAARGTPAVVYDVDGLRDSVQSGITGLVTSCTPDGLAKGIIDLLQDPAMYSRCRLAAWQWSQELTFDNSYLDFCEALGINSPI